VEHHVQMKKQELLSISIILNKNISINSETPPLKTFFIDRIIEEMKNKDKQIVI